MSDDLSLSSQLPARIQLHRTKGWRKPEGAITVSRPTKWGNPFAYRDRMGGLVHYQPSKPHEWSFEGRISADGMRHDFYDADLSVTLFMVRWATRDEIVELYRRTLIEPDQGMLAAYPSRRGRFLKVTTEDIVRELRGHDLACWCPLDQPCHADVLLELANA